MRYKITYTLEFDAEAPLKEIPFIRFPKGSSNWSSRIQIDTEAPVQYKTKYIIPQWVKNQTRDIALPSDGSVPPITTQYGTDATISRWKFIAP